MISGRCCGQYAKLACLLTKEEVILLSHFLGIRLHAQSTRVRKTQNLMPYIIYDVVALASFPTYKMFFCRESAASGGTLAHYTHSIIFLFVLFFSMLLENSF